MFYRLLLLFFLLILGHPTMAQDPYFEKELKEIESLIENKQFEIAQRKIDSLHQKTNSFDRQKKSKPLLLEIKYQQALLFDEQQKTPAKTLQILFGIIDDAEKEHLYSLSYRIYLLIALSYEKTAINLTDLQLTKTYLDKAYAVYKKNNLEEIYSYYCIRRSSYDRFVNAIESSFYFAKQAELYAQKYNNKKDLNDAYLLLGNYYSLKKDYNNALKYYFLRLRNTSQYKLDPSRASKFNNISNIYFKMENYQQALDYSDSAYAYNKKYALTNSHTLPKSRYKIYETLGNIDSTYHYFQQYHNGIQLVYEEEIAINTKKIEEQYQNDKKEATIKSKNEQMILIISLLSVIAIASVLLFVQNRKINSRNKIINKQLAELSKTLEQKQTLLSELQHRVKNNLQHVISILEIQK